MNLLQVTAGTGGWYCGTCLRDNDLVRGLVRLGHHATLVPLYLPVSVDGEHANPSEPVRLGGVSVYLRHESALWRLLPAWADAIADSRSMLAFAAKRSGMTHPADLGSMTVAMLRGVRSELGPSLERFAKAVASDHKADAVVLSNALLLGLAKPLKEALKVPVLCTLQGEDPFFDALPEPHRTAAWDAAREAATDADGFVAVSRWHADVMTERLGIPRDRVRVVLNGIDVAGFDARPRPTIPTLGFFARQCPDKGLDALVSAYLALRKRPGLGALKLAVGGAVTGLDEPFVLEQRRRVEAAGGDATWLPNATRAEKLAFFRGISVFSVPATYGESFGLYVLEALASGVPVVQPDHGGFPELLRETGGGVLVPPGDPDALADALEGLLVAPDRAESLGRAGRAAVLERFTLEAMARGVFGAVEEVRR